MVDPEKLSQEEWRYVMDRTQAPFHICDTQLVVLMKAAGWKRWGLAFGRRNYHGNYFKNEKPVRPFQTLKK